MSANKGYYSLVQYCPDLSRAESVNIGVVLLCPELQFLDVKLAQGNDRVRRFFGAKTFHPDYLSKAKRAIESRIRLSSKQPYTLEDLNRYIDTRANDIILTRPRPVKIVEASPTEQLDKLYIELVGGRAQRSPRKARIPELEHAFLKLHHKGKVRINERVKVPITDKEVKVPYAYQNGALNLVQPLPDNKSHLTEAAMHLAVMGDLIQRHAGDTTGTKYRFIVVSGLPFDLRESTEKKIEYLFRDYNVEFIRHDAIPDFVERVEREAHE